MELEVLEGAAGRNASPGAAAGGGGGGWRWEDHRDVSVPFLVVISALTALGIGGNILVLGSLIIHKGLRTYGNLLLANLAIADLVVSGFINIFSILGTLLGPEWFESRLGLCRAIAFICTVACIVSMLTIIMVTVNRYVHICHPKHIYLRIYTKTKTLLYCAAIWVVTCLMQIPAFFGLADYWFDAKTQSCLWDRLHDRLYLHVIMGSSEVLTGFCVLLCYLLIFLFVRKTRNKVQSSRSAQRERDDSLKLVRTILVIFLLFFFTWGFYTVISLGDRADRLSQPVHLWAITVAHANSSFNPIVYAATNQHFRVAYMRLLLIDRCVARWRRRREGDAADANDASSRSGASTDKFVHM